MNMRLFVSVTIKKRLNRFVLLNYFQNCQQITEWANDLSKELQPEIVSVALSGLQAKFAGLIPKTVNPVPTQTTQKQSEKRKAFIIKQRARVTASESELPLRRQQLDRLQSQSKSTVDGLKIDQESKELSTTFGEVSTHMLKELSLAEEALKRTEDIVRKLAKQVEIEEKRQVSSDTTGYPNWNSEKCAFQYDAVEK